MKRFVKKILNNPTNTQQPQENEVKRIIIKKNETEKNIQQLPSFNLKADSPISQYDITEMSNEDPKPTLKQILGIEFTFLTSDEIKNMATVVVKQSKLSGENSVYDPRFGPITNYVKCTVCSQGWKDCPGHPGVIEFPYSIPHPMRLKQLAERLTCICEFCHRLVLTVKEMKTLDIMKYKGENRFNAFLDIAKKTVRCGHCKKPHGKYTIVDDKFLKLYKKKSEIKKLPISYEEVVEIINNIREIDFKLLGFLNPLSHPTHMIMKNMLVLPSNARPFIESNNNACHDDLTHKLIEIVKTVNKLQEKGVSEKTKNDLMDTLMFHVKTFMDNSKNKARDPGGKRALKAIKQRLAGKTGLIRQNLQGKRTGQCGRTVISPDPDIHVNEVGIPRFIADKLTFPERVNNLNIEWLQNIVDNDQATRVGRGDGWITLNLAMYTKGFKLKYGDRVLRENKIIDPSLTPNFQIKTGDNIIREELIEKENGTYETKKKIIKNVEATKKKQFKIRIGDIVERKLIDGDWAVFNRQPTLHEASFRAKQVKIHDGKTFRFDLSSTGAYNADFDGDEMNLFVASSHTTRAEMKNIMSTAAQFISSAESKPMLTIKQDAMIGGYLYTYGTIKIDKNTFMDACCTTDFDTTYITNKIQHIKNVHKWTGTLEKEINQLKETNQTNLTNLRNTLKTLKLQYEQSKITHNKKQDNQESQSIKNKYEQVRTKINQIKNITTEELEKIAEDNLVYTGHSLFSIILPNNFEYNCDNKMSPDKKPVKITRGTMIEGTLNKAALGSSSGSLIHHLYKDYGADYACNFVTYYQRFMNLLLGRRGFSVGLEDCIPKNNDMIKQELNKCFLKAKTVIENEQDMEIRENKILEILNEATNIGEKITKESLDENNNFVKMIVSGAKGSMFNTVHITSAIGQQNIEGKRVPKNCGGRTLPCYEKMPGTQYAPDIIPQNEILDDTEIMAKLFQSRGFISSSFFKGLEPQEFFFLSAGGREGLTDTSIKTAKCGYLSRRLLKLMEDVKISYDGKIVNSRGNIVQFCYGENNMNCAELIKTEKFGFQCGDIAHIADMINADEEWTRFNK